MIKLLSATTILCLFWGCCQTDYVSHTPQYVVIKNYGGMGLTKLNDKGQYENLSFIGEQLSARTIIVEGDTLCLISPYYGLTGGGFNSDTKVILVNKILNRTDTLNVKFSLKKIDNCNEYPIIDEAKLNSKKGVVREISGLYGNIFELKYK